MRLHFVEKSKIKDYIDIFRKSVETYNTDWINSTTKQSPQDFIKKNIVTIKPWEFRNKKVEFTALRNVHYRVSQKSVRFFGTPGTL